MGTAFFFAHSSAWFIPCIFAQYSYSGFPYQKPAYTVEQVASPIPLLTSAAKLVSLPKLEINIPESSRILLNNTGQAVGGTVISGQDVTFTKGPALNDTYVFYQLNYRNNGYPNSAESGVTEDSLGSAVTYAFICYKKSYGSPQNALNHPDGYLVVLFQILIDSCSVVLWITGILNNEENHYLVHEQAGNVNNSYFTPYENALHRVKQPYTTTIIRTEQAITWLVRVLRNCPNYFVWPGTIFFVNPVPGGEIIPGKQYSGATTIQIPRSCSPFLSYQQFYTFPSIRNLFNESSVFIAGLHETNGRPIVQSTNGVRVTFSRG